MVDIYDFAQPGKFMILDVSARWCSYCQEMAKWMDGTTNFYGQYYGDEEWYSDVADAVDNGDIYWVTVLVENGCRARRRRRCAARSLRRPRAARAGGGRRCAMGGDLC